MSESQAVSLEELIYSHQFLQSLEGLLDQLDPEVVEALEVLRKDLRFHERHFPTQPELADAWLRVAEAALQAELIEMPVPGVAKPEPEPRYEPGPDETPETIGWDLFPIFKADPLHEAHVLIDACLIKAAEVGSSKDIKTTAEPFKSALQSKGEARSRLLRAVCRRWCRYLWLDVALETELRFATRHRIRRAHIPIGLLWDTLLKKNTTPTPEDLIDILAYRSGPHSGVEDGFSWNDPALIKAVERTTAEHELTERLRDAIRAWQKRLSREQRRWGTPQGELDRMNRAIDKLLGTGAAFPLNKGEAWSDVAIQELTALPPDQQNAWSALLEHAGTADGGKPKAKWRDKALPLIDAVGSEQLIERTAPWFELSSKPRTKPRSAPRYLMDYDPNLLFDEVNAQCLKGLAWCIGISGRNERVAALRDLALAGLKPIPGRGPTDTKLSNAAVWALAELPGLDGIAQLSILKTKVRHKPTLKSISAAFDRASEREGAPREELEELAVPTYEFTEVGALRQTLGDFTAELLITDTTTTELRWIKSDGKLQKTVPKSVKEDHAEPLRQIKAVAKDVQKLLPAQRDRIDQLHLQQQTWPYSAWVERYLNHPLLGTLSRRLIWVVRESQDAPGVAVTWLDGHLIDVSGQTFNAELDSSVVALWHPIGKQATDIMAWRTLFEEHQIKQPFKQAHREVYLLTDAERSTNIYSNRYAAHLIKQHQFNALCAVRGWKNQLRLLVDADYPPASLEIPAWGLRAEFWVHGVGDQYGQDTNDIGTFHYLATDQVRFYPLDAAQLAAHADNGGYEWNPWRGDAEPEPIPLERIPPLVLSEVMRDVDLFVGVASVGNDPAWEDGGRQTRYGYDGYWEQYSFGDLSATASTRKDLLQRLVPRLKIADQCSFTDKFLVVAGSKRTYKIHLGSGNILMEPNDQYLCIVPASRGTIKGPAGKVFLPFEGDRTLSIILSKAFMLAEDTKIKDPTVLSQIGQ